MRCGASVPLTGALRLSTDGAVEIGALDVRPLHAPRSGTAGGGPGDLAQRSIEVGLGGDDQGAFHGAHYPSPTAPSADRRPHAAITRSCSLSISYRTQAARPRRNCSVVDQGPSASG